MTYLNLTEHKKHHICEKSHVQFKHQYPAGTSSLFIIQNNSGLFQAHSNGYSSFLSLPRN